MPAQLLLLNFLIYNIINNMKKNICEMGVWNYLKLVRWRDSGNLGNLYTEEIFQRKSHKSCRQKKEIPDKKK